MRSLQSFTSTGLACNVRRPAPVGMGHQGRCFRLGGVACREWAARSGQLAQLVRNEGQRGGGIDVGGDVDDCGAVRV